MTTDVAPTVAGKQKWWLFWWHNCAQHSFSDWNNAPLEFIRCKATRETTVLHTIVSDVAAFHSKLALFEQQLDIGNFALCCSAVQSVSIRRFIFIHRSPFLGISRGIEIEIGVFFTVSRQTRAGFQRESIVCDVKQHPSLTTQWNLESDKLCLRNNS